MFTSIILGLIEGITEFLPISSTGHLILANQFFTFANSEFAHTFDIFIQLGAILAVLIYYRRRLIPYIGQSDPQTNRQIISLWTKTIIAFLPAGFFGFLFGGWIQDNLFSPLVVAITLLIGGLIIIFLEKHPRPTITKNQDQISTKQSLIIGLCQCLGMIPGTSRSAATIIAGLFLGFSRPVATEFSFFLAVPTLGAASVYSLLKTNLAFSSNEIIWLTLGFITAFFVSYLVISKFIHYIAKHNFIPFGYYRIGLALIIIGYFFFR